jgi:HSP20 family protein
MFLVPMTRHSAALARTFDRLFDDTFDRLFATEPLRGGARSPALDVSESNDTYTVKLDLPGVAKDDVQISIDGNRVSIEGKCRKDSEKKDGERVVYRERSESTFARSFTLPAEIDEAKSGAKLDSGVLTLTLVKRRAEPARRISVN